MTQPPHTTLLPVVCSNEIAEKVIGKPVYCDWFRIDSNSDGTYVITVSQGQGDAALNDLDHRTQWDQQDG